MRMQVALATLALASTLAMAQDPGMQAAQQAAQAAQMANQQAMQAAQAANAQAMRDSQQASQNAQQAAQNAQANAQSLPIAVPRPTFSVKSGTYATPLTVKIKAPRGTTAYYTTDGWTPTKDSTRYTGPIAVDETTTLQAVAIYNGLYRSIPASATYTLHTAKPAAVSALPNPPSVPETPVSSSAAKRILAEGTPVHLTFASDITSKTAAVGDKIPLVLAEDIKVGDVVLVKKGAAAVATVTDADGKHIMGVPGEVAFEAESLNVDGVQVKLRGGAAKEAAYRSGAAVSAMLVPIAGMFLVHGHDAEIKKGAAFVAAVSQDTPLPPAN